MVKHSTDMENIKDKLQEFFREKLVENLIQGTLLGAGIFIILLFPLLQTMLAVHHYSDPGCEDIDGLPIQCDGYIGHNPRSYILTLYENFKTAAIAAALLFVFLVIINIIGLFWSSLVETFQKWRYDREQKKKHKDFKQWSAKNTEQMIKNLNYNSTHQDEFYEQMAMKSSLKKEGFVPPKSDSRKK